MLIPFTRFVVGRSYGSTATIVPLTIAAAPYIARMVESSLKEVDAGVIEAARSMGASDFQIVTKVMLVEARTSLIVGATISLGTILGYSAMAGTVGGGGLGDIAIRYGLHQMADRYHGCHSGASGNFIPDFPDDRNEDCESAGSQKVAITNLHIFLSFKEDTIMKKKVLSTILAGVLALSAFAGCGSSTEESTDTSAATKEETPVAATEEAVSAENTESTDTAAEGGTIKVAASATPHAEILEEAKKILADEGWDLEIKIFDDYVMPNEVVESGEFDANYFQHIPYLESFNEEKREPIWSMQAASTMSRSAFIREQSPISPMLADGDTIAVPNDTTNEARALLLLQDNGIITLKEGAGLEATVNDIAENPHNVKIEELAAEQVARVAPEVAFVVLNGNYALQAGFSLQKMHWLTRHPIPRQRRPT